MQAMCDLVVLESLRELPASDPDPDANGSHSSGMTYVVISVMGRYQGFSESLARFLPEIEPGHICFVEANEDQRQRYYAELPALGARTLVFLCDLVLDSTSPISSTLRILKSYGARHIKCLSLFATQKEARILLRIHSELELFCALLDKDSTIDGKRFPFRGIPLIELPASRQDS
jgi:uracil phosphoribosyltransferase